MDLLFMKIYLETHGNTLMEIIYVNKTNRSKKLKPIIILFRHRIFFHIFLTNTVVMSI